MYFPMFAEVLAQPALQFLTGLSLALVARGVALLLLMAAGSLSRRVTQLRLSGLLEELTLYKFFERRPTVLMARAMELQLWTGFLIVAFCLAWAAQVAFAHVEAGKLACVILAIILAFWIGWLLIDLFRIVRPISQFQRYEGVTRERIATMKARVLTKARRLQSEQSELEELDENLKRMSSLADGNAFEDTPFFAQGGQASDPPTSVRSENAVTPEAEVASATTPSPGDLPVHSTPRPEVDAGAAPARPAAATGQGSVYQSAWMSGRVKRWPDGAPYGFITADTGEQFHAGADTLAGLELLEEGTVVLFQAVPGTPHRRAVLVCGIGSYAQGRVNGIRGNMGFITIQDSRRSASIYFRLPVGILPAFDIGDTVGFRFGRNILGPTAEKIDPDLENARGGQWQRN